MAQMVEPFKTDWKPAITFQTIGDATTWPKADSARCCIFEAINIVGSASNGLDWTGSELFALLWPFSPRDAQARHDEFQKAGKRVTTAPSSISPLYLSSAIRRPSSQIVEEPARDQHVRAWQRNNAALQYRALLDAEQERWETNRASLGRLTAVVDWLSQQCRDNNLTSYYRWQVGGQLQQMDPTDWNIDYPLQQFVSAGGYDRWFSTQVTPARYPVYLFFDRAAVSRAAAIFAHRPAQVPLVDLASLSPYLRFAIQLATQHRWSSPGTTLEVRCADVRAGWSNGMGDVPISNNMVESIARVAGFPNPTAILEGKRGGPRKK